MSTSPTVLGNGPLEFTDSTGKQVSIPLSALKFDPKNNNQLTVDPSKWGGTLPTFITSLLTNLAQQGLIVPAPVPSPKPALTVTAADPGSAGNNIQAVFTVTGSDPDPTKTKFSVTVTETDSYQGLSLDPKSSSYIGTILGAKSTSPGLVHVVPASIAASGTPASATPFKAASQNANAQSDVKTGDATPKTVFTLEAKKKGKDGEQTSVVSVGPNAKDSSTFDLTVQWTKAVTDLTVVNVKTNTGTALCYEVKITPPPSGIFSVPAGTVQLSGGSDGASATAASAIVFANQ